MDLKDQKFGIEIELTGISRSRAAEVAAQHFGTSSYYVGTYYDTYAAKDSQRREWKFMSDASIKAQKKEGKSRVGASPEYRTEMVSPICKYDDIVTIQDDPEAARSGCLCQSELRDPCAYRCIPF